MLAQGLINAKPAYLNKSALKRLIQRYFQVNSELSQQLIQDVGVADVTTDTTPSWISLLNLVFTESVISLFASIARMLLGTSFASSNNLIKSP
jgi:hypothetical protein